MNYIIYHTKRCVTDIGDLRVYHDDFEGNQDPYIWNKNFLHTFCHITQLKVNVNDLIFWVSGDIYPDFNKLHCDCIFLIQNKIYWDQSNSIEENDLIVDNRQTFEHHYKWAKCQHPLNKRRRYTLKANKEKSFQPQDKNKMLIDIVPFLNEQGITIESLINGISKTKNNKRARNSRPYQIPSELAQKLYDYLWQISEIKLTGNMLEGIHPNNIQE